MPNREQREERVFEVLVDDDIVEKLSVQVFHLVGQEDHVPQLLVLRTNRAKLLRGRKTNYGRLAPTTELRKAVLPQFSCHVIAMAALAEHALSP